MSEGEASTPLDEAQTVAVRLVSEIGRNLLIGMGLHDSETTDDDG